MTAIVPLGSLPSALKVVEAVKLVDRLKPIGYCPSKVADMRAHMEGYGAGDGSLSKEGLEVSPRVSREQREREEHNAVSCLWFRLSYCSLTIGNRPLCPNLRHYTLNMARTLPLDTLINHSLSESLVQAANSTVPSARHPNFGTTISRNSRKMSSSRRKGVCKLGTTTLRFRVMATYRIR